MDTKHVAQLKLKAAREAVTNEVPILIGGGGVGLGKDTKKANLRIRELEEQTKGFRPPGMFMFAGLMGGNTLRMRNDQGEEFLINNPAKFNMWQNRLERLIAAEKNNKGRKQEKHEGWSSEHVANSYRGNWYSAASAVSRLNPAAKKHEVTASVVEDPKVPGVFRVKLSRPDGKTMLPTFKSFEKMLKTVRLKEFELADKERERRVASQMVRIPQAALDGYSEKLVDHVLTEAFKVSLEHDFDKVRAGISSKYQILYKDSPVTKDRARSIIKAEEKKRAAAPPKAGRQLKPTQKDYDAQKRLRLENGNVVKLGRELYIITDWSSTSGSGWTQLWKPEAPYGSVKYTPRFALASEVKELWPSTFDYRAKHPPKKKAAKKTAKKTTVKKTAKRPAKPVRAEFKAADLRDWEKRIDKANEVLTPKVRFDNLGNGRLVVMNQTLKSKKAIETKVAGIERKAKKMRAELKKAEAKRAVSRAQGPLFSGAAPASVSVPTLPGATAPGARKPQVKDAGSKTRRATINGVKFTFERSGGKWFAKCEKGHAFGPITGAALLTGTQLKKKLLAMRPDLAQYKVPKGRKVADGPQVLTAAPRRKSRQFVTREAVYLLDTKSSKDIRELLKRQRKLTMDERKKRLATLREETKSAKLRTRDRMKRRKEDLLRTWEKVKANELDRIARKYDERRRLIMENYAKGKARTDALRAALRAEKAERAAAKKKQRSPAQLKALQRAREKRDEQLEAVLREIQEHDPSLVPYFHTVKGKLKPKKNILMYEQVLKMAQEHPDDVLAAQTRGDEKALRSLLKEGPEQWRKKHEAIEATLCRRATRAAKADARSGKPRTFALKKREEDALRALGVDPQELMRECYDRVLRRRTGRALATNRRLTPEQVAARKAAREADQGGDLYDIPF